MCGIAGIATKEVNIHDLELMLAMLSHRGPDEIGTYIDQEVAIGSSRLSIVDLEKGRQPVLSPCGNVVLVFNGEIYNYIELREILKAKGYTFKTCSDTEVLLNCYLEYDKFFVSYLNGQFSIAIWDNRYRKLILVRDRMGIKPLFFHYSKDFFIFGSEIKALLIHKKVSKKFNVRALDQIFTFWTPIGKHTLFSDIEELPPGKILTLQNKKINIDSYWDWPFPSLTEQSNSSFKIEKLEFINRLQKAVDFRLRADVKVGAYLSGGIDSSSIATLASKSLVSRLETYSIAFKEKSYDERDFQRMVSDYLKTDHHMFDCNYDDIENNFKNVIWHTETPIFRTAPTPLYILSRWVNLNKIKVVLTGEGSDEIILGYDLFRQLKIRKFWSRQPESIVRPQLFKRLYAYLPHFKNPRYANLSIQSFKANLVSNSSFYSHLIRWNNNAVNKVYFSDELNKGLCGYKALEELESILPEEFFRVDEIDKAQYLEIITLLRGYLLSSQGDRMAMAHSVESRFPFLDHEFITYINSLPKKFKLLGLNDKYILREAMKEFLPPEIWSRPKIAYQAPEIRPFIKLDRSISNLVEQYMNQEAIKKTGLYNWSLVEALIKKIQNTDFTRLGMRDNMAFVEILSTQLFYYMFIFDDIRSLAESKLKDNRVPFSVRIDKSRIPNVKLG